MKTLWNFHTASDSKLQDSFRALRIIQDLHRSIQYFNVSNINSPKFGYPSKNQSQTQTIILKQHTCSVKSAQGQRKSSKLVKADTRNENENYVENESARGLTFNIRKAQKKTTESENEQVQINKWKRKLRSRNESIRTKTFTLRNIKGVVFRQKK